MKKKKIYLIISFLVIILIIAIAFSTQIKNEPQNEKNNTDINVTLNNSSNQTQTTNTTNTTNSTNSIEKQGHSNQKSKNKNSINIIDKYANLDSKDRPWYAQILSDREAVERLKSEVKLEKDQSFGNTGKGFLIKDYYYDFPYSYYGWKVPVYNTISKKIVDYYYIDHSGMFYPSSGTGFD